MISKLKEHPYILRFYFVMMLIGGLCLIGRHYEVRFFKNISKSSPHKLFLGCKTCAIERDMYAIVLPESRLVKQYLGEVPIIKRILGMPGDQIQIHERKIFLNNEYVGEVEPSRIKDIQLSAIKEKTIPESSYFLVSDNTIDGFDSRYEEFGLIKQEQIKYRVWPIF